MKDVPLQYLLGSFLAWFMVRPSCELFALILTEIVTYSRGPSLFHRLMIYYFISQDVSAKEALLRSRKPLTCDSRIYVEMSFGSLTHKRKPECAPMLDSSRVIVAVGGNERHCSPASDFGWNT